MFLLNASFYITNYTVYNTPYLSSSNKDLIKTKLEIYCTNISSWFRENNMKYNPVNYHRLVTSHNSIRINIEGYISYNSTEEKLFRVKVNSQALLGNHVSTACQNAGQKLNALSIIAIYMDLMNLQKRR